MLQGLLYAGWSGEFSLEPQEKATLVRAPVVAGAAKTKALG